MQVVTAVNLVVLQLPGIQACARGTGTMCSWQGKKGAPRLQDVCGMIRQVTQACRGRGDC